VGNFLLSALSPIRVACTLDKSTRQASSHMVVLFDFCYWRMNAMSNQSFMWCGEVGMHCEPD
jgi:hypothetical protein